MWYMPVSPLAPEAVRRIINSKPDWATWGDDVSKNKEGWGCSLEIECPWVQSLVLGGV